LGGVEGVEGWVACEAGARPLRVQGCLGVGGEILWCGELLFEGFDGEERELAFAGEPRGAASLGLVGQVDRVALLEEAGGPAFAAVRGVEPVLKIVNDRMAKGVVDLLLELTVPVWPLPWMKTSGCSWRTWRGSSFSTHIWPAMYVAVLLFVGYQAC
jgi:hypothetical protein